MNFVLISNVWKFLLLLKRLKNEKYSWQNDVTVCVSFRNVNVFSEKNGGISEQGSGTNNITIPKPD